jgi:hypothetical protein
MNGGVPTGASNGQWVRCSTSPANSANFRRILILVSWLMVKRLIRRCGSSCYGLRIITAVLIGDRVIRRGNRLWTVERSNHHNCCHDKFEMNMKISVFKSRYRWHPRLKAALIAEDGLNPLIRMTGSVADVTEKQVTYSDIAELFFQHADVSLTNQ